MNIVVDQIMFNPNDLTYKLYYSYGGNQQRINISQEESITMINNAKVPPTIECSDKKTYWIFNA